VEGGEQIYALQSMIGTLFSYSSDTMDKQLFSSSFVKDEAGKADDATNKGYLVRRGWTNLGASKEFYGKLFVDMFRQNKYLIGNVNMRIKLIKAAHSFAIWSNIAAERSKFVIESAKLYVRKVRPNQAILANLESNLILVVVLWYIIQLIALK